MVNLRAYYGTFHQFTPAQRDELHAQLKLDRAQTDVYLNMIEGHVQEYIGAVTLMADFPLEPAALGRQRLRALQNRSKLLADSIDALHPYQSGAAFEHINYSLHEMGVDLDELRSSLEVVAAVANAAASKKPDRGAGRPQARVHYAFIAHCVRCFESIYGHTPRYGHRSRFQNFLVALTSQVLPPGQSLQGNITRLIKAAIEYRATNR